MIENNMPKPSIGFQNSSPLFVLIHDVNPQHYRNNDAGRVCIYNKGPGHSKYSPYAPSQRAVHFYKAKVSLNILVSAVKNVKVDFKHKVMMYKKMNE